MRYSWRRRAAVTIVAGLILSSTSAVAMARTDGARPAEAQRSDAAVTTRRVRIVNFAFAPGTISIARGTRVRWANMDSTGHTTTSNSGAWDSGVIAAGGSFGRVFRRAGTFRYHCSIHTTMHGTIRVT